MSRKHDAIFDDVLSGLGQGARVAKPEKDRSANRFLNRGNALGEKLSGEFTEKTIYHVDPAKCKMWERHNRAYDLLTPENCEDLINGIRAQGAQEFPAIVRKIDDPKYDYEVIAGARRHFAVSWLRANHFPQFKYLVEVRDLTDEEAFRLADIENRDRRDISDYERAVDYAGAIEAFYGGKQKSMAERLQVSEGWLSRYLYLAKLPKEIVEAYISPNEIKEIHARQLKPLMADQALRAKLIKRAGELKGQGLDALKVLAELKATGAPKKKLPIGKNSGNSKEIRSPSSMYSITYEEKKGRVQLTFSKSMTRQEFLNTAKLIAEELK